MLKDEERKNPRLSTRFSGRTFEWEIKRTLFRHNPGKVSFVVDNVRKEYCDAIIETDCEGFRKFSLDLSDGSTLVFSASLRGYLAQVKIVDGLVAIEHKLELQKDGEAAYFGAKPC